MQNITNEKRYIQIGLKIAYYRRLRGMTQEELAELIGINPKYLSRIETPTQTQAISLKNLFAISDVLEVPAAKFLDFDV